MTASTAAYRQLRTVASTAEDGTLTSLIDARLDMERRVIREAATLDQLRRDRVALADRLPARARRPAHRGAFQRNGRQCGSNPEHTANTNRAN